MKVIYILLGTYIYPGIHSAMHGHLPGTMILLSYWYTHFSYGAYL